MTSIESSRSGDRYRLINDPVVRAVGATLLISGGLLWSAARADVVSRGESLPAKIAINYKLEALGDLAARGGFNQSYTATFPPQRFNRLTMLGYINTIRATAGKRPLILSPTLDRAAQTQANHLASHPLQGGNAWTRLPLSLLRKRYPRASHLAVSEDVSISPPGSDPSMVGAIESLVETPGDYENMVSADNILGVGQSTKPDGTKIYTFEFGQIRFHATK